MSTPVAWRGRRVLVTGGGGFLGARAVRLLLARGAVVRTASRAAACPLLADLAGAFEHVAGDLSTPGAAERAVDGVEVVLHFAAGGVAWNPDERCEDLVASNLVATERLLLAAGRAGVRKAVLAGSVAEYGGGAQARDPAPLSRATPVRPMNAYGVTKAAAAWLAALLSDRTGVETTTLRVFSPFGPGEPAERFLPTVLRAALAGRPLPMTPGRQVRDFCFVDDVAAAFLDEGLRVRGAATLWNLGTGRGLSLEQAAQQAAQAVGRPLELQLGALPYRPGEAFHLVADAADLDPALARCLSTSFADGCRRLADDLVARGVNP